MKYLIYFALLISYLGCITCYVRVASISQAKLRLSKASPTALFGVTEWRDPIQPFDETGTHTSFGNPVKSTKTFNSKAAISYFAATTVQWTLIVGFLHIIQHGVIKHIPRSIFSFNLNHNLVSSAVVFFTMLSLSLRSRIFSPLDNTRPKGISFLWIKIQNWNL